MWFQIDVSGLHIVLIFKVKISEKTGQSNSTAAEAFDLEKFFMHFRRY